MVAQFVATRPILALCEGTERRGGETGPPKMVGADGNRLETGAGAERKRGDRGRRDGNSHGRDGDNDAGGGGIGFRNGIRGGGGVTGGQWLQWGGVERGGGVKVIHLLQTTRDTRDYLPQ